MNEKACGHDSLRAIRISGCPRCFNKYCRADYILAEQDRRAVDYFIRSETCEWQQGSLGEMDIVDVDCGPVKVGLALDDIYEDFDFYH